MRREQTTDFFVAWALVAVQAAAFAGCAPTSRARVVSALDAGRVPDALSNYELVRDEEGPDEGLLEEIALELLVREALREDEALAVRGTRAVVSSGTFANAALRRIAAEAPHVSAQNMALEALARRGDDLAEREFARRGLTLERPSREPLAELSADNLAREWLAIAADLDAPDVQARLQAVDRALRLSDRTGLRITFLRRALVEPDPALFLRLADLLADDADALHTLSARLAAAASGEDGLAAAAARLLVRAEDPRGPARLDVLLRSPRADVRRAVVSELSALFGPDRARRALRDEDESVRFAYAISVLRLASRRGF